MLLQDNRDRMGFPALLTTVKLLGYVCTLGHNTVSALRMCYFMCAGFVAEQDGQQYMDVLFPLDSLRAFSPSYLTSSWQHKEFKDTSMAILDPLMDTNNLGKSIATLNAKRFLRAVQLTHPKVACIFQAVRPLCIFSTFFGMALVLSCLRI